MGKASSAKKIARAARAGGGRRAGARQRNLLFPGVLAVIVVVGAGLVGVAWRQHETDESIAPVAFQDHWHAAFGVYVCDEFLPDIGEFENPDNLGIHTHGDGVIHIHPFSQEGAGDSATLGMFLRDTGEAGTQIEVTDTELTVGDETWTEGEDTCGEEGKEQDGQVVLAQWKDVTTTDAAPALITENIEDTRFREDAEGYTLAFVPEDADIPKPQTASNLAELGAIDAGVEEQSEGATTTAGNEATTTAPGGATTTARRGATTTTAAERTTTTSGE